MLFELRVSSDSEFVETLHAMIFTSGPIMCAPTGLLGGWQDARVASRAVSLLSHAQHTYTCTILQCTSSKSTLMYSCY